MHRARGSKFYLGGNEERNDMKITDLREVGHGPHDWSVQSMEAWNRCEGQRKVRARDQREMS